MLADKRILLIIGGGIAAYKVLELIRLIDKAGGKARAILTKAGAQFVTPLSVSALTGDAVFQDLFDLTNEAEMGHIQLSRDADLVLVAPATADLMAKMAQGIADDLATTALLATDKPVVIAPAMNVRMWEHAATKRNVSQLQVDGIFIIPPTEGAMACGEFGPGRMAEPADIFKTIVSQLTTRDQRLSGKHILVTSGPTHEPIDPVRYLANRSSGRQGYAIAEALAALGARVTLVSGPSSIADPGGVNIQRVETAVEMLSACENALPADAAVMVAAVADWRVETALGLKLKKNPDQPLRAFNLAENPDILTSISHHQRRPELVVGFAAETNDVLTNASAKRIRKGCDWIVANDVSAAGDVMGTTHNHVHIITADDVESWPRMSKVAVAERLAHRIAGVLGPIAE